MALNDNGDRVYLFGGYDREENKCLSDLWVLDLTKETWTQCDDGDTYPAARYSHTCAVLGCKLIIFGMYGVHAYIYPYMHCARVYDVNRT